MFIGDCMRVISGKYKGRIIKGFDINGTRPTMDRVKESMFAIIQNYLKGAIVLDLFAGSGNLGIESLSNGSICAYFVDNNKIATNLIKENIEKINIEEETYILNIDYLDALNNFKKNNIKFDIIFLDPPYKDKLDSIINYIYENNLLNKEGIIVLEYEIKPNIQNYNLLKEKKYGSKGVMVLGKI